MNAVCAIVGPTASGKSDVADLFASALDTSVISVDAMQVYKGMDIGTAKMKPSEHKAPLLMVDVADIEQDYSVQQFQTDARALVDELHGRGKLPVLCGGTGLYLNAVIDDMVFPDGSCESPSRLKYWAYLDQNGAQALHELLASKDAASAELIHPNNSRRVLRALEMLDDGVSYADQHKGLYQRKPYYEAHIFGLLRDRENLYQRINLRVDKMFDEGLVEEVEALRDSGIEQALTSKQAIGYKEVLAVLSGEITMDEARELVKINTRRYAKRQMTWFKKDERITWIDMDNHTPEQAQRIIMDAMQGVIAAL